MTEDLFLTPKSPVTRAELAAFEQELGRPLPEDYANFLLTQNGGAFTLLQRFNLDGHEENIHALSTLTATRSNGLRAAVRHMQAYGIADLLPVGDTWSQNSVCIDLTSRTGEVVLCIFTYENSVATEYDVKPLADSFTSFLGMLRGVPEIVCPIRDLAKEGAAADLDNWVADGFDIESQGAFGTMLIEAIRFQNLDLVRACLRHGATVSGAVAVAVSIGAPECLQALLDADADVNEIDSNGERPLSRLCGTALQDEDGDRKRRVEAILQQAGAVL